MHLCKGQTTQVQLWEMPLYPSLIIYKDSSVWSPQAQSGTLTGSAPFSACLLLLPILETTTNVMMTTQRFIYLFGFWTPDNIYEKQHLPWSAFWWHSPSCFHKSWKRSSALAFPLLQTSPKLSASFSLPASCQHRSAVFVSVTGSPKQMYHLPLVSFNVSMLAWEATCFTRLSLAYHTVEHTNELAK